MTTQTALITGASGGIGKDFATVMAREGYNLILVARRENKLQMLADELTNAHGIQATVIPMDLSQSSAPQDLFAATEAKGLVVDVLVNNAGFATYGKFHELPIERELMMMQLNINTLVHLTHLYLQGMVERGAGRVLNVASTAAFQPGPLMAVYYASKSFVLSFSEALANELSGSGVRVTALCPGPTESDFQSRANMEASKLVQNGLMSSMEVVEIGYRAMLAGKSHVIPGLNNKVGALATRFVPRDTTTNVVRNMQEQAT
jgi:uncharacterized protein